MDTSPKFVDAGFPTFLAVAGGFLAILARGIPGASRTAKAMVRDVGKASVAPSRIPLQWLAATEWADGDAALAETW